MAQSLVTERSAESPLKLQVFNLHVFELAYVMSLMHTETVAALPDAVLFPKDAALRKKMLAEGEKRLIANGRITPGNTPGQATYDDDLLSMTAAIADPRFTILTRRETCDGKRADATIFFNKVEVVEVVQTQKEYFRLRRISDATEAFHRVRKMLGVTPLPLHGDASAELPIEVFERVRQRIKSDESDAATAELVEIGLPAAAAAALVAALATPQRKGVVSVLKHVAQKVTDVRVLGFYLRDGGAWLTSVVIDSADRVRVEAVDADGFIRRLVDRVASVTT